MHSDHLNGDRSNTDDSWEKDSPHLTAVSLDLDTPYGSPCSLGSPQIGRFTVTTPISPALLSSPMVAEKKDLTMGHLKLATDDLWLSLDNLEESESCSSSTDYSRCDFYPNIVSSKCSGELLGSSSGFCSSRALSPEYVSWCQTTDANTVRHVPQGEYAVQAPTVGLRCLLSAAWSFLDSDLKHSSRGLGTLLIQANWQLLRLRASCILSARAAVYVALSPDNVETTRVVDVLGRSVRSDVLLRLQNRWELSRARSDLFVHAKATAEFEASAGIIEVLIQAYSYEPIPKTARKKLTITSRPKILRPAHRFLNRFRAAREQCSRGRALDRQSARHWKRQRALLASDFYGFVICGH